MEFKKGDNVFEIKTHKIGTVIEVYEHSNFARVEFMIDNTLEYKFIPIGNLIKTNVKIKECNKFDNFISMQRIHLKWQIDMSK